MENCVLNGTKSKLVMATHGLSNNASLIFTLKLNNRYTKAQTYSNAEIEQRITDLLGLANLQDTGSRV